MPIKHVLDLRGVISPLDLFKCKKMLASMASGEILEVILKDRQVADNLTTIILKSGDDLSYRKTAHNRILMGIQRGRTKKSNTPSAMSGRLPSDKPESETQKEGSCS